MQKIELLRKLLEFGDCMTDPVLVRIVTRDENGTVIAAKSAPISYLGNFMDFTTITIEESKLKNTT